MNHHLPNPEHLFLTRRSMLQRIGMGFGSMALGNLFAESTAHAAISSVNPLAIRSSQMTPKAKRVVHFFMNGGPSQVDTFDPKPALDKYDGKPVPNLLKTERPTGAAFKSPFK